ncbi:40S ribosomal protein S27-like [Desmophyllum pertusum]|uniref:40S ribosomal protein S27 n=1 Tax=Desmophyllum pertusum TaxID=174260 RepID=A0A9X0A6L3_9CNID|nr:40S ribosomal protein S27-like [Desmophyllum pertusum]
MPLFKDLLHPSVEEEKRKHKLKRLVQSPNSYFMDVKCPGCYKITTVFSHAQTVVLCVSCSMVLCQPTGGRARLTEAAVHIGGEISTSCCFDSQIYIQKPVVSKPMVSVVSDLSLSHVCDIAASSTDDLSKVPAVPAT